MRVQVTQEDIDEAVADATYGSAAWCPIARAIRRLPDFENRRILVVIPEVVISSVTGERTYWLPEKAIEFIYDFDGRHFAFVAPFEFELQEIET